MSGPEKGRFFASSNVRERQQYLCLTSESVQSSALSFQSIDDIHGGNSLSLGVLGVCDCITDDVLKEDLQDSTGLFVDQTRDTLDSSSASKTTNRRLRDTLDVITKNFA